jgi:multidrug resistance efflux pump
VAPRRVLTLPGRVEAVETARLFAQVRGVVRKVQADIGDHVKQGQVLAELAVPDVEAEVARHQAGVVQADAEAQQAQLLLQEATAALDLLSAQVQEAEAGLQRARASRQQARANHERVRALFEQQAVGQKVLDEAADRLAAATAALAEAEAKLQAAAAARKAGLVRCQVADAGVKVAGVRREVARADLQRATALLSFARVVAPFDGVVVRRSVSPGDLAGPPQGEAKPLFIVARIDSVRVVVFVPDRDAARLRVGAEAAVRLDAFPGQVLKGKVARLAGALDGESRGRRAEIDLPNPDGKLLPGMSGSAAITLDQDEPRP